MHQHLIILITSTTVNFATGATTMNVAASNAPLGAGTQGGNSVAIIASDKTRIVGDVEMNGKFDSGTSGSRTATFTTTADVTNFLTIPGTVNFQFCNNECVHWCYCYQHW